MSEKLARAIKDLRADLNRDKGGLVKVFGDQLSLVLDALEDTIPAEPVDTDIREGDFVEIKNYSESGGVRNGMTGTVLSVKVRGSFPYKVQLHAYPQSALFSKKELKKVVKDEELR